ncbi:hypothetical protein WJT74_11865 [Sphingomicrobium sp. XHP0239]|uniref:hypothetical protein n=1 Tax=Sphingomicrobium maritimum TaxID=3133972 RepID=UPI0031CC4AEA
MAALPQRASGHLNRDFRNFLAISAIQCRMDDLSHQKLSPHELREMADTSGDPVIRRALETLARDVEEEGTDLLESAK